MGKGALCGARGTCAGLPRSLPNVPVRVLNVCVNSLVTYLTGWEYHHRGHDGYGTVKRPGPLPTSMSEPPRPPCRHSFLVMQHSLLPVSRVLVGTPSIPLCTGGRLSGSCVHHAARTAKCTTPAFALRSTLGNGVRTGGHSHLPMPRSCGQSDDFTVPPSSALVMCKPFYTTPLSLAVPASLAPPLLHARQPFETGRPFPFSVDGPGGRAPPRAYLLHVVASLPVGRGL